MDAARARIHGDATAASATRGAVAKVAGEARVATTHARVATTYGVTTYGVTTDGMLRGLTTRGATASRADRAP